MRFVLSIFILFTCVLSAKSQNFSDEQIDSLVSVYYSLDDDDTNKLHICNEISLGHYNADSTIVWAERQIALAKRQNNLLKEAGALFYLAWAYYFMGDSETASKYNFKSILLYKSLGIDKMVARNYAMLGDDYLEMSNYAQSIEYYTEALDYYLSVNDSVWIANLYRMLAQNYTNQGAYRNAEDLYMKSMKIDSSLNNQESLMGDYNMLAWNYMYEFLDNLTKNDLPLLLKAKGIVSRNWAINEEYGFDYLFYSSLFMKSLFMYYEIVNSDYGIEYKISMVDSLKSYCVLGDSIVNRLGFGDSEKMYFDICRIHYNLLDGKFDEAKKNLDSISDIVMANEEEYREFILFVLISADNYYSMLGDYKNAHYYRSLFYEKFHHLVSGDFAVNAAQNLARSEFDNQLRINKEREERNFRIIIYIAIGISLVLAFIIFEYFRKRKHNRILNEKNIILQNQKEEILQQKEELNASKDELFARNEEISAQNEEISYKNKQITDSINYASLIQKAALPRPEDLSALFGKYFLIYRPLNIVAGDFYWASQVSRFSVFVCADCTGHGVPGAFVSMLGISLLNEVTANVSADTKASDILNELRAKLMRALGQSKKKYDNGAVYSMDGMDLAMVMIDYENMSLQFAGAYRPLWIWRKGELLQYKPDKMPIGLYLGPEKEFSNQEIELQEGDVLYMFSDGIPDQFGYTDDSHTVCKHFSSKKLATLLTEIGGDPLPQQKARIESEVDAWKNGYKQLDDNILIGIRI